MEEFVREPFVEEEIDMDYEFDAARFYDFTRDETDWEIEEAEQWFEFAGCYLPSPFFFKLNWRKLSSKSEDVNTNNREISEAKAKSLVKSKRSGSSTLMKPTASQLAKQVQPQLLHTIQRLRRFGRKLGKIDEKSLQNSSVADNLATKRQKLEAGYLSKVAELKHQPLLSHKSPKRAGPDVISASPRRKATTPREFDLETAHRAERHRIKIDAELAEQAKPNGSIFKARPLNRKILEAPLPLPNRSRPQLPEFQEFHLKTSERAMQHTLNNLCHNKHSSNESNVPIFTIISKKESEEDKRLNSVNSLRQEKYEAVCNFNDSPLQKKELKFVADKRDEPPIYLFSKLSLTSGGQHSTNSRSKGPLSIKETQENKQGSFLQENGMINVIKERPKRLVGKEYKCACDRPELQQLKYGGTHLRLKIGYA